MDAINNRFRIYYYEGSDCSLALGDRSVYGFKMLPLYCARATQYDDCTSSYFLPQKYFVSSNSAQFSLIIET